MKISELTFWHVKDTVGQILYMLDSTFKACFTLFCNLIFVSDLTWIHALSSINTPIKHACSWAFWIYIISLKIDNTKSLHDFKHFRTLISKIPESSNQTALTSFDYAVCLEYSIILKSIITFSECYWVYFINVIYTDIYCCTVSLMIYFFQILNKFK